MAAFLPVRGQTIQVSMTRWPRGTTPWRAGQGRLTRWLTCRDAPDVASVVTFRVVVSVNNSDADSLVGSRRHRVTQGASSGSYLRIPKVAPQSWLTFTVPRMGPGMKNGGLAWEEPVMLVTVSCGRGLSVGNELFG